MNEPDQPTSSPITIADEFQESIWSYNGAAAEETHSPVPVTGGVINMRFISAAVRRGIRIWGATAAIGLLVGCVLITGLHRSYQATVTILLTNNPGIDAPTQMQTDALIAQDPVVAASVIKDLGLGVTPTQFLKDYSVTVTSNEVLTIAATTSSPDAAVAEANAVATEFLKYRTAVLENQQAAITSAQNQQIADVRRNLNSLNNQISQVSAAAPSTGRQAELNGLQLRRDETSNLLTSLEQSASASQAAAEVTLSSIIKGSQILDSAAPVASQSTKLYLLEYIGAPFFGGLVIGLAVVIIRAVTTDRLRRRDDIAAALGAPVKMSVTTAEMRKTVLGGQRSARKREADTRRIVAYLRSVLPEKSRPPASLCIVAVDNTRDVAELVIAFAASLASDNKRVGITDLCGGVLAGLLGVQEPGARLANAGGRDIAVILPDSNDGPPIGPRERSAQQAPASGPEGTVYASVDVLLTVATLDPAMGGDYLATWASNAVVIVTAGRSSAFKLQAVGEMVRQAGTHLTSTVLLGTDRDDQSLGISIA